MKTVGMVLLMAIMALGLTPLRGEDNKADAASDLKALDAKLTDAYKAGDFKTLAKHTADDYMLIDPRGGLHNKEQYLGYLTKGKPKVEGMKETDVKVRVFGDTGVVTGVLQVKGKDQNKEISPEYRWTRVYNKKGGEWRCVLEQHTFVQPKEEKK